MCEGRGKEEPAARTGEAVAVPSPPASEETTAREVMRPPELDDFPLEQSRDETLKNAYDRVRSIDGQLLQPEAPLSFPYFSLIKERLYRVTQDAQSKESMVRKFVKEDAKNWDKWLEPLLFAVREVPQASTGFSPFELLYGRQPRGVLDVIKESWEEGPSNSRSEIQYVMDLRAKLHTLGRLSMENLLQAQDKQRRLYNRGRPSWSHSGLGSSISRSNARIGVVHVRFTTSTF